MRSGTVLGVPPSHGPEEVTAVLGPGYAENVSGAHHMWRDYGLAEFFWGREAAGQPWQGHHFTLQVHRLAYGDRGTVNPELRSRYGRFARRLRFARLRALSARRGVPLLEVPSPMGAPSYRLFRQPASGVTVTVVAERGPYMRPRGLRPGDVYAISGTARH
ncbi:hypothetical protein [Streptomyces sp. MUM 203J]|uniref:hypothetical protein n=1 Tax=Streptomyces sp. MUM 203J TaxID=2791990 RepID=UPI001F04051F|nr:hypothetical protein [Streptomyces sp. MUM 203J]